MLLLHVRAKEKKDGCLLLFERLTICFCLVSCAPTWRYGRRLGKYVRASCDAGNKLMKRREKKKEFAWCVVTLFFSVLRASEAARISVFLLFYLWCFCSSFELLCWLRV